MTATISANLAPQVTDDTAQTIQDQAVIVAVLANDIDPELQPLTVAAVGQGADGSVAINPDQTVTYTPDPG